MTGNPDPSLTIDTHHHILPDFFWQETENAHAPVGGLAPLRWSKEASVSFMDDAGIDVAVVSVSTPGVHTGDSAKASALARRCNEFAVELVRTKPDRFASFACLPMPDIDASLKELSYAHDVLGVDGLVLFTNANGVYLGDAVLEPVFEELERRHAVMFVHPNPSPDAVAHSLGLPDNLGDPVLRMLRDVAGINQVLYGTDFPYQRRDLAAKSKHVLQSSALNDVERVAVLGGNASLLFPRLQSARANGDVAMRRSAATQ
jgi:predicted TIM-barrel fold metal-dependent hydrolase